MGSLTWRHSGEAVDLVSITSLQGLEVLETSDFDFSTLDNLDTIERIEIVRGPTSAVQGADAVAGALQVITRDGKVVHPATGTPQGGIVSPILANVYLHYVFDLWADQWRSRHARGDVVIVRFADDIVMGFEHRSDAERFHHDLRINRPVCHRDLVGRR